MFSFSSQLNHNSLWFTSCEYDFEIIQHIHNSSKGEQIWIFISLQTHSVVSFCHFCDLIQIIYLQWILCTLWCVDAICSKVITIFFVIFSRFTSFIHSLLRWRLCMQVQRATDKCQHFWCLKQKSIFTVDTSTHLFLFHFLSFECHACYE